MMRDMDAGGDTRPMLVPRPVAPSVDVLLHGAIRLGAHTPEEARSSAGFERVIIDGERCLVKYVHPDRDFTMRVSGDLGCRPLRVWAAGLMDLAPDLIDHAQLGAAPWGRNGWGAALLMRDVGERLVPPGDDPITEARHLTFLDHCAGLSARTWGWHDQVGLLPHPRRWGWFGTAGLAGEEALGFPELVPRLATEGWVRFDATAPPDIVASIDALRRDPTPLSDAVRTTPGCFVHGDWKLANLGCGADGRTILLDWAYPGEGPACHELVWYLALNRARLPTGHTKERVIADFRSALEANGVDTADWWDRQLGLCLLGGLVQFGWEKALGDGDDRAAELGWWFEAARSGMAHL